ncbi:MAG: hypothetical protein LBH27_00685 [Endomicrobium sp.]|nr:hypothetical protein [Endomicrobium sp.]
MRNLAFDKNIKTSQMFHSIRIAVSGRKKGPSLFHMMEVIGKKEVAKRINIMIDRFFS